jgi:hypothetical protein
LKLINSVWIKTSFKNKVLSSRDQQNQYLHVFICMSCFFYSNKASKFQQNIIADRKSNQTVSNHLFVEIKLWIHFFTLFLEIESCEVPLKLSTIKKQCKWKINLHMHYTGIGVCFYISMVDSIRTIFISFTALSKQRYILLSTKNLK